MSLINGPGIYYNIPAKYYHSLECPGISRSDLELISRSPLHYLNRHTNKEEGEEEKQSKDLLLGKAFHSFILERDNFYNEFAVGPSCGKQLKADKEKWAEFNDSIKDKNVEVIDGQTFDKIKAMAAALDNCKTAKGLLTGGQPEVTAISVDDDYDVTRKTRADYVRNDGVIVDLKTTGDASHTAWSREVITWSLDRQAAYYLDNFTKASGQPHTHFIFICVEKKPPYGVAVYLLDDACIEVGRKIYKRDLKTYNDYFCSGRAVENYGYPDQIQFLTMKKYGFDYENR